VDLSVRTGQVSYVTVSRDFVLQRMLRAASRQAAALQMPDSWLVDFRQIVTCLHDNPKLRPGMGKLANWATPDGAELAVTRLASRYHKARMCPLPTLPAASGTIADPVIDSMVKTIGGYDDAQLRLFRATHSLAMVLEAKNGELLEAYLDQAALEQLGWIRCWGSTVLSVDFIRPRTLRSGRRGWTCLQVKNQDNSENSSSARVRRGTKILKWHRRQASDGTEMWEAFPDPEAARILIEAGGAQGYADFAQRWAMAQLVAKAA
jgi:hypothetical protein